MIDIKLTVIENVEIASSIRRIRLRSESALPSIRCGQFLHIETGRQDTILRRPFCICMSDEFTVTIVFAVIGKGTEALAGAQCGDSLNAILPLGNGFVLPKSAKKVAILGGGLGTAPLLMIPKQYKDRQFIAYLGFSSASKAILVDEFKSQCDTIVCTDDGSMGERGYLTEVFERQIARIKPDYIVVCGNSEVIKQAQRISTQLKIEGSVALEARMGCGVGACLVCTCKTLKNGVEANERVCVEGPVFNLNEVVL